MDAARLPSWAKVWPEISIWDRATKLLTIYAQGGTTLDIFSKREGPRAEDVKAKRMISENMPVIRKLADQISNGGFTQMRQQQAERNKEPQAEGKLIFDMKARATVDEPEPYVKVSLNNRVVLADRKSARQLAMIGEIRGNFLSRKLFLATRENGFISPLDEELLGCIAQLEGVEINTDYTEEELVVTLEQLLGLTPDSS